MDTECKQANKQFNKYVTRTRVQYANSDWHRGQ